MTRASKYSPANLTTMFRLAAALRKQMQEAGFTDNGGAIHSAQRILDLLGMRVSYPGLSHIDNLCNYAKANFSVEALAAHKAGESVFIEHVNPHRALTKLAIGEIERGVTDEEFIRFVKENYQLALLTAEERSRLDRQNRTGIDPDRLSKAGIDLASN